MEDYKSAAIRHYADAKTLREAGQLDNAGHLIGFAAECAIKLKITVKFTGEDSPHGHLPGFLIAARKQLGPRSNYSDMFNIIKADVFQTWSVNRRYFATGNTTLAELDDWFKVTGRLFAVAQIKERK